MCSAALLWVDDKVALESNPSPVQQDRLDDVPNTLSDLVPDLVQYAVRKGVRPTDAEDIAQETIARLLAQPRPVTDQRAWGFRVAQRLITDRARRRASERRLLLGVAPLVRDVAPDTAEAVAHLEVVAHVSHVIAALPERYRQVILRLDVDRASRESVASELGVSPEVLRQTHHRARKALRKSYLSSGGSLAGLALVFPALRDGHRLKATAVAACLPIVGGLITLGSSPSHAPWSAVPDRALGPYVEPIYPGPLPGDTLLLTAIRKAGESLSRSSQVPIAGSEWRPGILGPTVPPCGEPTGLPTLCENTGEYKPDTYAIGIAPPPPGEPLETVIWQEDVDTTPLCPIVLLVPYTICQKGY